MRKQAAIPSGSGITVMAVGLCLLTAPDGTIGKQALTKAQYSVTAEGQEIAAEINLVPSTTLQVQECSLEPSNATSVSLIRTGA